MAVDQMTQQLIDYRYYLNYLQVAKTGETEKVREQAKSAVETYLRGPTHVIRTPEQADELAAQVDALQARGGPQIEGVVTEVTQKNVIPLVESSIQSYRQLMDFMDRSRDLAFLQDCQDMDQLAIKISFQAQNIIHSGLDAQVKKALQDHESGQSPLSAIDYQTAP